MALPCCWIGFGAVAGGIGAVVCAAAYPIFIFSKSYRIAQTLNGTVKSLNSQLNPHQRFRPGFDYILGLRLSITSTLHNNRSRLEQIKSQIDHYKEQFDHHQPSDSGCHAESAQQTGPQDLKQEWLNSLNELQESLNQEVASQKYRQSNFLKRFAYGFIVRPFKNKFAMGTLNEYFHKMTRQIQALDDANVTLNDTQSGCCHSNSSLWQKFTGVLNFRRGQHSLDQEGTNLEPTASNNLSSHCCHH
jgi:hypothetical protein